MEHPHMYIFTISVYSPTVPRGHTAHTGARSRFSGSPSRERGGRLSFYYHHIRATDKNGRVYLAETTWRARPTRPSSREPPRSKLSIISLQSRCRYCAPCAPSAPCPAPLKEGPFLGGRVSLSVLVVTEMPVQPSTQMDTVDPERADTISVAKPVNVRCDTGRRCSRIAAV